MKKTLKGAVEKLTMAALTGQMVMQGMITQIACDDALSAQAHNGVIGIIETVRQIYQGSVFWLLALVNVAILLISKNDKVLGAAKKTMIGLVAFYIILSIPLDTFTNFINGITGFFTNGG